MEHSSGHQIERYRIIPCMNEKLFIETLNIKQKYEHTVHLFEISIKKCQPVIGNMGTFCTLLLFGHEMVGLVICESDFFPL